ncbi:formylglycine-generating enzyme family protein [Roseovarius sp. E0-M6]|uniref:formylglycine-generating enzyme family protein n=1 Tax=Roseovarius sp. E0-M6 TaxID=3127118 RepID=UPI00300FD46F
MAAAALKPALSSVSLRLAAVLGLAAVIGLALLGRGSEPELAQMPEMAHSPVAMPGGALFYAQKYEVSLADWAACVGEGACALDLRARADQAPEATPATGLSHVDAGEFVAWISAATGHPFRLPTVAEWSQMARGVVAETADPIFTDPSLTWASAYLTEGLGARALRPRGSFSVSGEGVADLDGSVWEWTQDCYAGSGDGTDPARCPAYFVAGEHIAAMSYLVRDPARGGCAVGTPPAHLGLRLVSDSPF